MIIVKQNHLDFRIVYEQFADFLVGAIKEQEFRELFVKVNQVRHHSINIRSLILTIDAEQITELENDIWKSKSVKLAVS